MEGYLDLKMRAWVRRLVTRLLAIVPAMFTILYYGDEKLSALLIFSQVILSMQLGFAVIPLIHFCSDQKYMKEFTIPLWVKILSWASAFVVVFLNAEYVFEEFAGWMSMGGEYVWLICALVLPAILLVFGLLVYVTIAPLIPSLKKNDNIITQ
jgi:manganese transport protein